MSTLFISNSPADLLSANSLADLRIGISVSESPDLGRLGLLETHFRLALAEIARCVLVAGGNLAYGGHLDPNGYTPFLMKELLKYGRRDRPLRIYLAWQEHRRMPLSVLEKNKQNLGLYGKIVYLDPSGQKIDPDKERGEEPQSVEDPKLRKQALTSMRLYMGEHTHGRVLIGGKRNGFQGEIPGLMEEALIALKMGQPLYLAGGFGGVTADIARALGVNDGTWLPQRPDAPADDPRLIEGRDRLQALTRESTWTGLSNGLTIEENQLLAVTHRPSEIATLVSLGLGRHYRHRGEVS